MAVKKIKKALGPTRGKPKEFKCMPEDPGEEEIILVFNDTPDQDTHDIIKLERTGLPANYPDKDGKRVDWIGNFGIKNKKNDGYVDGIPYMVIVTPRENQILVCFNGETDQFEPVKFVPTPPEYPGKIAFELKIGDPGSGWVTR